MTDGLTLKELSIITNQPFYKITYLRRIGKLSLIKDANGKEVLLFIIQTVLIFLRKSKWKCHLQDSLISF